MPLVSIIIATYNSEKTLSTALDSVVSQSFQDWECIIVDGASKDNTVEIIKNYVSMDSRIRYISEPDNGVYDAFNKGWKMARGEWVQYLGCDDKLTIDGFLDMHLELYSDYPIVTGDVYINKTDGTTKINMSAGYGGCHQGKFTKREILKRMNGFDEQFPILADYDLMLRMKYSHYKIKNIRVNVAYFAMDGISQNFTRLIDRAKERYRIERRYNNAWNTLYSVVSNTLNLALSIIYRKVCKMLHQR